MTVSSSKVEQVTAQLRTLIAGEAFEDGRLPSEPDLSLRLGASRATVRQALAQLASSGLVVRKHGIGTFVNTRVTGIRTRLEEVWDFAEMIQLAGYAPSVAHCALTLTPAPQSIAEILGLAPGAEVLTTSNIFLADSTPVIYCIDVIPAGLVRSAYHNEELHGPTYRFLSERCDQRVDHNIAEIRPVIADETLVATLHCEPGSPLHYFEEVGYNSSGVPILYSEEYYRPEFFTFKVFRQMTTSRAGKIDHR